MSAIMGSLLVILGTFGFSVSLCLEYRMRLILLKQIRGVYEYGCELFRKRMECAIMLEAARALDEE